MPDNHCCGCCNCDEFPDTLTVTLSTNAPATVVFQCQNGQSCQTVACGGYITGSYVVTKPKPAGIACQWGGGGELPGVVNCIPLQCQPLDQTWSNQLMLSLNQTAGESGPRFSLSVYSGEPPVGGIVLPAILTCYSSDVLDCSNITFPITLDGFQAQGSDFNCSGCGGGTWWKAVVQ